MPETCPKTVGAGPIVSGVIAVLTPLFQQLEPVVLAALEAEIANLFAATKQAAPAS